MKSYLSLVLAVSLFPAVADTNVPSELARRLRGETRSVSALDGGPLHFEPNLGQQDARVLFEARGRRSVIYFTAEGLVFTLPDPAGGTRSVRMQMMGASEDATPRGIDRLGGHSNYFRGDRENWRSGIPHFARLSVEGLYPGIDAAFYGSERRLEYDFILAPGADPNAVTLRFDGVDRMTVDAGGDLVLHAGGARLVHHRPHIYQEVEGERRLVNGRYIVRDDGAVGFELDGYDRDAELVIDPVIEMSTFAGGSDDEWASSIVLDSDQNIFIVASTESTNFPVTPGGYDTSFGGDADVVVFKMNPTGSEILFASYVGGSGPDLTECHGKTFAVDTDGNVYVAASTSSMDFPTTPGAYDTTYNGGPPFGDGDYVAFILGADGSELVYSTYFGGSDQDEDPCMCIDSARDMYIVGQTESVNMKTTPGTFDFFANGDDDIFILKLSPDGNGARDLLYGSYFGGNERESDPSPVLDDTGMLTFAAETSSTSYPTTDGAFDTRYNGGLDFGVTQFRPDGNGANDLVYSTYFGGGDVEELDGFGVKVALGPEGDIYFTGETISTENDGTPFPVTPGAYDTTQSSGTGGLDDRDDIFVARLRPGGQGETDLIWCTYIGGIGDDEDSSIGLDSKGYVYIAGESESDDYPLVDSLVETRPSTGEPDDIVISVLTPDGSDLVFSTYLGGTANDDSVDLVVSETPNGAGIGEVSAAGDRRTALADSVAIYVVGESESSNFPTTEGVIGPQRSGGYDLFITKIVNALPVTEPELGAVATLSAASFTAPVAPDSIATPFAEIPVNQNFVPLSGTAPTELGGISIQLIDSASAEFLAGLLFVGPTQANVVIPPGVAEGEAIVNLLADGEIIATGKVEIKRVAPGIFFVGNNVAAAFFLVIAPDGTRTQPLVYDGSLAPAPVSLTPEGTQVYVLLFGTGFRNASTVTATVNGVEVPVLGFLQQPDFLGLDQVNIGPLPASLIGQGQVEVVLTFDGVATNGVIIAIQ